jgi:hypothetical protein
LRYQMLLMQAGKAPADFKGRYDLQLTGNSTASPGPRPPGPAEPLQVRSSTHGWKAGRPSARVRAKNGAGEGLRQAGAMRATQTPL